MEIPRVIVAFSSRTGTFFGRKRERRTALRLVQSTRVLKLSNMPSPHRGAGGLKTPCGE